MAKKSLHVQRHVIPADLSEQQPSNTYVPILKYESKRVPCSACGAAILWTAEQQRTWYEEIKAPVPALVSLRCDVCRKRGQHDRHRQKQRSKAKRRLSGDT